MNKKIASLGSIMIIVLMLGTFLAPMGNIAHASSNQSNKAGVEVEILLNITKRAISFSEKVGINVTQAKVHYNKALKLYRQGNYTGAIAELKIAMKSLAEQFKMRHTSMKKANATAVIKAQLIKIEVFVNNSKVLSHAEKKMILSKICSALSNVSKGNITVARKILSSIRNELKGACLNASYIAKQRVKIVIRNEIKKFAQKINQIVKSKLGNITSEYKVSNLSVMPIIRIIMKELYENKTNTSIPRLFHMLIAIKILKCVVETNNISSVVNQSYRIRFIWPFIMKVNMANESLLRIKSLATNNKTKEAISLMEASLNLTKYSIKEYILGNDKIALKLVNESLQDASKADKILSNESLRGVGVLIGIDKAIINFDKALYSLINNTIIVGKEVYVLGFVLWNLTNNSYLVIGHIIPYKNQSARMRTRGMHPMFFMWQLIIVNTTKNTTIKGSINVGSLIKMKGVVTGKEGIAYEINASFIEVLPGNATMFLRVKSS
ncbi:MAG: hypothetical protein G5Z42_07160 [Caldisphaeraceae archaeon]|nr:hypothetical protein [Caldisphaeraceae archaeon]MEB3691781.1 hypothetical protein [Caldisphaeraceae archaeon]MEB3798575.1 hypothetical protein [Caldisphaeraceae archaeon]